MAMTPRENLRRCIHFKNPERVPLFFGRLGLDDTVIVYDFFTKDANGIDPWGSTWVVHPDFPSIGIINEHPVESPADLHKIRVPDPKEFVGYVMANLEKLTLEQRDKYRLVNTSSGIWERVQNYYGMDRVFNALVDDPDIIHTMVKLCTDFWVAFLEELAPVRNELDAIYMFDDWGTQQDIMISPRMWRDYFASPYRRITDAAHANGMDFWLHSCGRVTNLINDFIEVGMDLVNPYQSGTCGYEEVAERFSGKVAFLTTVDTQSTLTHGSPAEVVAECRRLANWGTAKGGLAVASYPYDTPEENERAVLDFFQTYRW